VLGFLVGLSVGLVILAFYRVRYGKKLRQLLQKLRVQSTSQSMPYESQIASAIATQTSAVNDLNAQIADFQQILRLAPLGYLHLDDENRLIWANTKACDLLGFKPPDLETPRLLLAIVRSYELDHLVEQTRQTQRMCQQDWTFYSISPDPSNLSERPAYPLRGYGMPLRKGHVGIFLENRQEAVTLAQQRDRWTSDVAHELKTPLTSIRLVAETLRSRVDEKLVSWLDRLLNEVTRLTILVEDILNLSHLEQFNERHQILEETNLAHLLRQAWQSLEPQASLKTLRFHYQGPDPLIIKVHSGLMFRVFVNLLDNAIKHTPSGTTVTVKTTQLEGTTTTYSPPGVLIEVIDAGNGFAEKDLPLVFERFYRSDLARSRPSIPPSEVQSLQKTVSPSSSGTGLGLSIVRKIVQSHQGWVKAENHPDTHGGWLKVWLPVN
jgi:two-component system phosphate regulon sensor histidine kinase PhoR